jgi:hypothetical protein
VSKAKPTTGASSHEGATQLQGQYRIPSQGGWADAWKLAAAVGVVGLAIGGFGYTVDPERFAFAYLFAFFATFTIPMGAIFFVLIQHLTGAGWSVTVRRTGEFFAAGVIVLPLLFLPIVPAMDTLYPWLELEHAREPGVAHAQDDHGHMHGAPGRAVHGAPAPSGQGQLAAHGAHQGAHGGHHDPEHAAHEAIMAEKAPYLNSGFFGIRAILYFLIWLWLARRLYGPSTRQDQDGDPQHTVRLQRFAPAGIIVFALSITFAGFDWFMSLEPNWYSTMFGVHVFASSAVAIFSVIILTTLGLKRAGLLGDSVHVEHYHDLGKLQFGFLVFWAYITFSEFFLIWYSAIPEETIFYHKRWDAEAWMTISVSLVVLHFIFPFYLIMSRNVKRRPGMLAFGAGWILLMHMVEAYWLIMPYAAPDGEAIGRGIWIDLACLVGLFGIYLAVVLRQMRNHALIPIKDPRLSRALHFVNA